MTDETIEEIFSTNLGPSNVMITRVRFSSDYSIIKGFSIGHHIKTAEKFLEVIRFDGSEKEPVNVHESYFIPPKKHYLNKPLNVDTILEISERIKANWRIYQSKYLEQHLL